MFASLVAVMRGRSSKWPAVERDHLEGNPCCAVCGTKSGVVAHHKVPVHIDKSQELNLANLITLCKPHHLLVGHLMLWKSYNPEVDADAAMWRRKIKARP